MSLVSSKDGEGVGAMNGLALVPQADKIGRVNVQHR